MAAKKEKLGSAKRFGARYGTRTKYKFAQIEKLQRAHYICPDCRKKQVRRVSVGIWNCKSCGVTFAGKAYTVGEMPVGPETKEDTNESRKL